MITTWHLLPESRRPDPEFLLNCCRDFQHTWYTPFVLMAAYTAGGLLLVPVTSLVITTAVIYPPGAAFGLAMTGMALNTTAVYWTGRIFEWRSDGIRRLRDRLSHHNIWMIALIRMVPIAHFTVVSIALGAARVRFRDVIAGTLLGMIPGTFIVIFLTDQGIEAWQHPDAGNLSAVAVLLIAGIGVSLWVRHRRRKVSPE